MESAVNEVRFPSSPRIDCPNCALSEWALPGLLTLNEARYFSEQLVHGRNVKRGEYAHHSGAALASLNVVNSGFLKSRITGRNGNFQITGFSMRGDMIGLDALGFGIHQSDAIALQDTRLCGINCSRFEQLMRDIPTLQHVFLQKMGSEIARGHKAMVSLGAMQASERMVQFLLNLSNRFAMIGCSNVRFRLPMQRQEIGEYLGLKLETVSRLLSHLQEVGAIVIYGKDIEITNERKMWESVQAEMPMQREARSHQTPSKSLKQVA